MPRPNNHRNPWFSNSWLAPRWVLLLRGVLLVYGAGVAPTLPTAALKGAPWQLCRAADAPCTSAMASAGCCHGTQVTTA